MDEELELTNLLGPDVELEPLVLIDIEETEVIENLDVPYVIVVIAPEISDGCIMEIDFCMN